MAKHTERAEFSCSFCGARSPRKLIGGPGICICNDCVTASAEILGALDTAEQPTPDWIRTPSAAAGSTWPLFRKPQQPLQPTCSFCGKLPPDLVQPPSKLGTQGLICGECVALCQQLIAEELPAQV